MVKKILLVLAAGGLAAVLVARSADQPSGRAIFTGKGSCFACHGPEGRGTPTGPNLTDAEWLHGDGSVEAVSAVIRAGVARPLRFPGMMPPMGGARLNDAEVRAVAAYVVSLSGAAE